MRLISFSSIKPTKPAVMLALGLISFSASGSHPEPGIRVETVEVPVPTPCVPADQIADEPETVGARLTGDPKQDLAIVSASALELRAWGRTMHAALTACAN